MDGDLCVGVDGVKGRWLAVSLRDGTFAGAAVCATIAEVLDRFPGAAAMGVDTPIGFDGFPRRADVEARRALAPHGSRVFATFPAEVYRSPDHAAAVARARELTGSGISRQAWAIGWAILDAAAHAGRVVEVHPELSFLALTGRVLAPKASWRGLSERIEALAGVGIHLPVDDVTGPCPPADVLDAAAAAWTAQRIARHDPDLRRYPPDPRPGEPVIVA